MEVPRWGGRLVKLTGHTCVAWLSVLQFTPELGGGEGCTHIVTMLLKLEVLCPWRGRWGLLWWNSKFPGMLALGLFLAEMIWLLSMQRGGCTCTEHSGCSVCSEQHPGGKGWCWHPPSCCVSVIWCRLSRNCCSVREVFGRAGLGAAYLPSPLLITSFPCVPGCCWAILKLG